MSKKVLIYVLAVLIGLTVAAGIWVYFSRHYGNKNQKTVYLPVAGKDIFIYEKIDLSDLKFKEIPENEVPNNIFTAGKEIVGKYAAEQILKGQFIFKSAVVSNLDDFSDKCIISLNIDSVRISGAKPGDIVDVYWASAGASVDSSGVAQIVPFSAKLIAQNAEVVKISAGNLTKMESALKSAGFVDLIVSKKEAPAVVAGALPDVKNIVLVRKFTKDKGLENEQEGEESAAFFQKKEAVP